MITKIKVDGFKSLNNFELEIKTGINILVGPNGSGKTNIILFFEFLSNLVSQDLHTSVTKAGGAGAIFRKIGETEYDNSIKCCVEGCRKFKNSNYIKYNYSFTVGTSFDKDFLFFEEQHLKAKIVTVFTTESDIESWDLELLQEKYSAAVKKSKLRLKSINLEKFKPRFLQESKGKKKQDVIETGNKYLSDYNFLTTSIVQSSFSFGEACHYIYVDFKGGETFNIVPSKVKQPEDSSNPPGIKKDGSGLANTLYAMKKSKPSSSFTFPFIFFNEYIDYNAFNKEVLDKIIENVKLANRSILKLDVTNDPFDNQLLVKVYIKAASGSTVLPLSAMSDGTIKWITLITAILTSREIFSIEEPENFLHPLMQAEIVNIMRNTFDKKDKESFIIMTTHSETLLNYSNPEEVIIASLNDGNTTAKRLENPELINQEVINTGFGLGYYYVSEALN